jgi:hypothetical protein
MISLHLKQLSSLGVELSPVSWLEGCDFVSNFHDRLELTSEKGSFFLAFTHEHWSNSVRVSSSIQIVVLFIIDKDSEISVKSFEKDVWIVKFLEKRTNH